MLRIKTFLAPSDVHGIGLFAAEHVRANTIVCEFIGGFDMILEKPPVRLMPFLMRYAYLQNGAWFLNVDDMRFCNHSEQPNISAASPNDPYDIACRDIKAGDEILCDYYSFDELAREKLAQ